MAIVGWFDLEPVDPVAARGWIGPRLGDLATVAGLVPADYPAYARVLHPAGEGGDVDSYYAGERRVTWAEVAAEVGTRLHPHALDGPRR